MKITGGKTELPAVLSSKSIHPPPDSDPLQRQPISRKQPRRKTRSPRFTGAGLRLKRDGASSGRRSRPETPLLRWKFDDGEKDGNGKREASQSEPRRKSGRKVRRGREAIVSARKLAAGLWRLQLPDVPAGGSEQLGFQAGVSNGGGPFLSQHNGIGHGYQTKDCARSPHSVSGPRNGLLYKLEPSFHFSNSAMEGATKWDPTCHKASDESNRIYTHTNHLNKRAPATSSLEAQLDQAQSRIHELETERQSSKKKLEHFLKKLAEERTTWRSREHEKVRAIIDDIKSDLSKERKTRQRVEVVNSKLVNELTDAKLLAKRYMQEYEKERKARELIEEVCDELAKEIGEDKAEVEALKRESMKLREEVEDERKMLQMAEVWREERVQMKLIDAKIALEDKYSQMNQIVSDLENFLGSKSETLDSDEVKKTDLLRKSASSVNVQEIKEFTYEPSNTDDIFSVFEEVNFGEHNKDSYIDRTSNVEEEEEDDGSGWETVSHPEEQGSSYSPAGSDPSVNKVRRQSNDSGSLTEWEENPAVAEKPNRQLKKASSISRLWKSCPSNGENYKIISAVYSPDLCSGQGGGLSPSDLGRQWSSPESGKPHMTRAKGCIEWPRGAQKNSLKAKLLEARIESQKVQLRQVLKQKI